MDPGEHQQWVSLILSSILPQIVLREILESSSGYAFMK
jgi:hypothetical protein